MLNSDFLNYVRGLVIPCSGLSSGFPQDGAPVEPPFDLARGGELLESFRINIFAIRIFLTMECGMMPIIFHC
jgi:hypothetical protein